MNIMEHLCYSLRETTRTKQRVGIKPAQLFATFCPLGYHKNCNVLLTRTACCDLVLRPPYYFFLQVLPTWRSKCVQDTERPVPFVLLLIRSLAPIFCKRLHCDGQWNIKLFLTFVLITLSTHNGQFRWIYFSEKILNS